MAHECEEFSFSWPAAFCIVGCLAVLMLAAVQCEADQVALKIACMENPRCSINDSVELGGGQ